MKNLFSLFLLSAFLIMASSCGKEELVTNLQETANEYPAEITIDNWEMFVNAPKETIQIHLEKEIEDRKEKIIEETEEMNTDLKCNGGPLFGNVKAWKGYWSGIHGVEVEQGNNYWTSTNLGGNYALCSTATGAVCMSYSTSETNGVSTLDLVLIQKHILNLTPFTTAREYVAADVNHDGQIDNDDLTVMRNVILGISGLPGNNVSFVPTVDLVMDCVTDSWCLSFLQNNCRNNASYHNQRYAIKIGDVSGNFSF